MVVLVLAVVPSCGINPSLTQPHTPSSPLLSSPLPHAQPFSSNVCSASGDKTVSVWDARSGLCVQTLYGHANSVNHLAVSNRGDMIVSSDADGAVKVRGPFPRYP